MPKILELQLLSWVDLLIISCDHKQNIFVFQIVEKKTSDLKTVIFKKKTNFTILSDILQAKQLITKLISNTTNLFHLKLKHTKVRQLMWSLNNQNRQITLTQSDIYIVGKLQPVWQKQQIFVWMHPKKDVWRLQTGPSIQHPIKEIFSSSAHLHEKNCDWMAASLSSADDISPTSVSLKLIIFSILSSQMNSFIT